ncbi:MAG: DUF2178 domain-containing protein [ANME-2 cluster archaeon]|nr:DUF2178 domain-containing protein [ANME-2 cluster archaeon]MBC2700113.1 DUF2178 domain-containing protein [ANME-2 cluster archaeon]MBC2708789.1 DUF2178 domain-containing protein [ANME-2 cluster archaeon]MBC2748251.1 DUF2178 domain-containing protein [ANME-2 cluster archaeon]
MEKYKITHLTLTTFFGIVAIVLYSYGDMVLGNMMACVSIGLFISYIIRRVIFKNELKKDEMVKRISGQSSDIAFYLSIISIGLLTIVLHFLPTLFDAFEVLAIILTVILVSKFSLQLYYSKVKCEIGF